MKVRMKQLRERVDILNRYFNAEYYIIYNKHSEYKYLINNPKGHNAFRFSCKTKNEMYSYLNGIVTTCIYFANLNAKQICINSVL